MAFVVSLFFLLLVIERIKTVKLIMRITKVSVEDPNRGKQNIVLMDRNTNKGRLIIRRSQSSQDVKSSALPNSILDVIYNLKNDSFRLSVLNQTVEDRSRVKIPLCDKCSSTARQNNTKICDICQKKQKTVKLLVDKIKPIVNQIICDELGIQNKNFEKKVHSPNANSKNSSSNSEDDKITLEDLDLLRFCLKKKFRSNVKFQDKTNVFHEFCFLTDLGDYLRSELCISPKPSQSSNCSHSPNPSLSSKHSSFFDAYRQWVRSYVRTKKKYTKHSIDNNKLVVDYSDEASLSPRKKCLLKWGDEYRKSGMINLQAEEKLLGMDELIESINKVRNDYGEPIINDDLGNEQMNYEFNVAVKRAIQSRQKAVFGLVNESNLTNEISSINKRNLDNRKNANLTTYFNEVVKYFEHYFPIKSKKYDIIKNKKGNKKGEELKKSLRYLEADTIKSTVLSQIQNAVRLQFLQQGKSELYDLKKDTTDSDQLSLLKRDEFFVLNLIEACAFATNNIRNIVGQKRCKDNQGNNIQCEDILGQKITKGVIDCILENEKDQSLNESAINSASNSIFNKELFNSFYGRELSVREEDSVSQFVKTIWAMRGSVQQIRNEIIHFHTGSIDKIFNLENFEYLDQTSGSNQPKSTESSELNKSTKSTEKSNEPNRSNEPYTETIFKDCLQNDLNRVSEVFVEKLQSNDVLNFYSTHNIQYLLEKLEFSLCKCSIPFAPGFKNIYEAGKNLQNAGNQQYINNQQSMNNQRDGRTKWSQSNGFNQRNQSNEYNQSNQTEVENNPFELYHYLLKGKDAAKTAQAKNYSAYRFLLKILYDYCFINRFLNDKKAFEEAVRFTLDNNKAANKNKAANSRNGNRNKFAFNGIPYFCPNQSIEAYFSEIHSLAVQEENKKKEKDGKQRLNTQRFITKVFVKGFDNYLKKIKVGFLLNSNQDQPKKLTQEDYSPLAKSIKVKSCIDVKQNSQIAFYTFCKLLDAQHLSDLRNEFIKYKASNRTKNTETSESTDKRKFEYIIDILGLCLLSVDSLKCNDLNQRMDERTKQSWKSDLEGFVDNRLLNFIDRDQSGFDVTELYGQSDNYTPVAHASIRLLRKYGTMNLLKQIIGEDYLVSVEDCKEWWKFKEIAANKERECTVIEDYINTRTRLHDEWKALVQEEKKKNAARDKGKGKPNKDNEENASQSKINDFFSKNEAVYVDVCNKIERYNWLDNKIHLVHLRQLHNLMIQILSRLTRFVALWDRDFVKYFAQAAEVSHGSKGVKPRTVKQELSNMLTDKEIKKLLKKACSDKEETEAQINDLRKNIDFYINAFGLYFEDDKSNSIDDRNYIAHYNYITEGGTKSIFDLIKRVRRLMEYDRKLHNAVIKSIINVFNQNGMELRMAITSSHELILEDNAIIPKTINHLGTKDISTNLVSEEYCKLCQKMLEMKK